MVPAAVALAVGAIPEGPPAAITSMLAFEPRERNNLQRPPRNPRIPPLTQEMVCRIFFVGLVVLVGGFDLFEVAEWRGSKIERARTIAVSGFILIEIVYRFDSRSLHHSAFRIGCFGNPRVLAGAAFWSGRLGPETQHQPRKRKSFGSVKMIEK